MARVALLALLLITRLAFGGVTLLPGSSPQTTISGSAFPNPVQILVTDSVGNPQPNATVRYSTSYFALSSSGNCIADALVYACTLQADANGVASAQFTGGRAGDYLVNFSTTVGSVQAELHVLPRSQPFTIQIVSGGGQTAVLGQHFAQPIVAHVSRNGQPVAGVGVSFSGFKPGQPSVEFDPSFAVSTTDAQGFAQSTPFKATLGLGRGTIIAAATDYAAPADVAATTDFTTTSAAGLTYQPYAPLWWGGPTQSGWGVSIPQHGASLFPVYFTYDFTGRPTWFVLEGAWGFGAGTSYSGTLAQYRGSPYFAFDTTKVGVMGRSYATLAFDSAVSAKLVILPDSTLITPPLPQFELPLQPFDFAPAVKQPERGVSDIWWGGPSQSGWGISIAEAQGNLFVVWFTYDSLGRPVWFSMSEGAWVDASTWAGPIYLTSGTGGFGVTYNPAAFHETKVGDFTLRFDGTTRATFEYSLEGHMGTLALQRFDY